jgi:hypothetical protein
MEDLAMKLISNNAVSAPTLNIDFVWKPSEQDKECLSKTLFYDDETFSQELLRTVDVTIPVGCLVLHKLEVFAGWADIPLPELISRLLSMEVTQYGPWHTRPRLQVVSTSQH